MTFLATQVLTLLLSLTPYHADTENSIQREARLGRVAIAIASASDRVPYAGGPRELARVLVTLGWHESRFAQHVHEGRCRPTECDKGLARSPWQLHARAARGDWRFIGAATQDATTRAAYRAAQTFSDARRRCRSLRGAFAGYATGYLCRWKGAMGRAKWLQHRAVFR